MGCEGALFFCERRRSEEMIIIMMVKVKVKVEKSR